ncbi:PREDICTED: uncharacterized protein LOC104826058 [Tarenaya hassleriana]|uniref:uncharacterized protein LOC104826058 n=1 Tax=Tarenaya hassleriana TaxID=28532 RepID=UPI00053CA37F|nr:PREDICTED: uncharacterized protein LOC104826058 [Tarenaya hassleriana]
MNGHRRRNDQGMGRQIPGCLGRMVNLFDLAANGGGNKMLTDKPHYDGSSLSRSRSAVPSRPSPPMGDYIEDEVVVSEIRSTANRVNGTPMKKLIAQEMSKEMDYKLSPTNVVAKLMGLDSLPQPQSNASAPRSNSKSQLRRSLSHEGIAARSWERDFNNAFQDHGEYKDVYEIWHHPGELNNSRKSVADNESYSENLSKKKMDVIREKFIEAKRLVTDEKLRHSKEFQDAMEVLSSNKELFLEFLQESNNFFSEHLHDFQSVPSTPETKRITILKPSKVTEKLDGQVKKTADASKLSSKNIEFGLPLFNQMVEECPARKTRIVVLKPSPGKGHFARALASSCPTSPRGGAHGEGYRDELDEFEERDARNVARRVTKQIHRNLMEHRDETVQSSVFSNGYIGDDSSFNRSENDYLVENLSDSEIMSPVSRHSWDYVNRYDSPYSSSPFSRASCYPDSSVCREAKKRLSERWALMASNGNFQEQKGIEKSSSSTLGEMLALSDLRNDLRRIEEGTDGSERGPRFSTSCLASNLARVEGDSRSPKGLERSKSVPESLTVYKSSLDLKVGSKAKVPEELTKSKSVKWSLKGKVSNFFFSRNKKSIKEKSSVSHCNDESRIVNPETPYSRANDESRASVSGDDGFLEQCQSIYSQEADVSTSKPPPLHGNASERGDQPSPISVLGTSFDDIDRIVPESSILFKPASPGPEISSKSNIINKSPPIGSFSRTLSRDDSRAEPTMATRYSSKRFVSSQDTEDVEEDWRLLVNTLLSTANLDGDESLSENHLSKWHSLQSPLDPSLRNKYTKTDDSETVNEAKRQRLSSSRKLVFDLVNSFLLSELTTTGFGRGKETALGDSVRIWMQEWFSGRRKVNCGDEEDGDGDLSSLAVDRAARAEAAEEGGWPENKRREVDGVGEGFEEKLLEELLEETVNDLTQMATGS